MTALFVIDRSLVVRFGNITYQFNRKLDNGKIVQFENQHTGEFKTFSLADFYSKVQTGVLVPILGSQNDRLLSESSKPPERMLDVSALPTVVKTALEFQTCVDPIYTKEKHTPRTAQQSNTSHLGFLCHCKKKTVRVCFLLFHKPPSASTVMSWMRRFENSGKNVASLLSGNTERKRKTTVHPEVEKLMMKTIDKWYLIRGMPSLQNTFDRLQI